MSRLLYRLGAWCARRKVVVFLAWLAVIALVAAGVVAFGLRTNNDVTLPGTGAQHASDILRQSFPPQQNSQSPVVFHATQGKVTDAGNKRAIESRSPPSRTPATWPLSRAPSRRAPASRR